MKSVFCFAVTLLLSSKMLCAQPPTAWKSVANEKISGVQKTAFAGIDVEFNEDGVTVTEVLGKHMKTRVEFQAGDIIRSIGGHPVSRLRDWNLAMKKLKPGESVSASIERNGKTLILPVVLEKIYVFPREA
jgi:S1-C subfamily serine protease